MKYTCIFLLLTTLFSFKLLDDTKTIIEKKYKYMTYFGCQVLDNEKIDKAQLDQLIQQPICAKDSTGRVFKVHSFEITYAERGLYEDSAGLPIIVTDYQSEIFKCDTLPTHWRKILQQSAYKGDTIHIESVVVVDDKNRYIPGAKSLHLIVK